MVVTKMKKPHTTDNYLIINTIYGSRIFVKKHGVNFPATYGSII